MSVKLVFSFPVNATFEEVSEVVALHFGGAPVNLSTGAEEPRDPSAVFAGASSAHLSVSTGADVNSAIPQIEVDKEGLPWDERIHSSTRGKNEDGTWKLRRGMANSKDLPVVKAELLQKMRGTGATPVVTNLHDKSDEATRARLDYAHEQAIISVGPMVGLMGDQFEKLKKGQVVEVSQTGLDWFSRYQQAFNASYAAYAAATLADNTGTVHMNTQSINPGAAPGIVQVSGVPTPVTNAGIPQPAIVMQPVTVAPAGPGATAIVIDPSAGVPQPAPATPITTFPEFAAKYATLPQATLDEAMSPLGLSGGLAGLATQQAMIPAVVAMLAAKGL